MANFMKAARVAVSERSIDGGYPVTVTFEDGTETHGSTRTRDEVLELAVRFKAVDAVLFKGKSFIQLND